MSRRLLVCRGSKAQGIHCARDMTYRMQGFESEKLGDGPLPPATFPTICEAPQPSTGQHANAIEWHKSLLKSVVCRLVFAEQVVVDF